MDVINKIIGMLKNKNINQTTFCKDIGISKQMFTDWKSGRIKSYTKYIPQIAEYLGVSADELLGIPNAEEPDNKKKPTADEDDEPLGVLDKAIIKAYEKLTPENKAVMLELGEALLKRQKK